MIPKSRKFPLRTEFLKFRRSARRQATQLCTMYYVLSTGQSRLSVIVPKKVNKLATTRNWLRRLTYDTLWPLVKDQNLDVVIIFRPLKLAKSPAAKAQIVSEIEKLLHSI